MTQKTKRPPIQGQGHTSSRMTPEYAIEPLLSLIPKSMKIWESAAGTGNLVSGFAKAGFSVVGTDIQGNFPHHDFFKWSPGDWDVQVTNPPYDVKTDWLRRSYELAKPFALLLPYTAFETPERQGLFDRFGIQIIFMDGRISFETPGQGSSAWFPTAWFCWQLELPKELNFYEFTTRQQALKSKKRNKSSSGQASGK